MIWGYPYFRKHPYSNKRYWGLVWLPLACNPQAGCIPFYPTKQQENTRIHPNPSKIIIHPMKSPEKSHDISWDDHFFMNSKSISKPRGSIHGWGSEPPMCAKNKPTWRRIRTLRLFQVLLPQWFRGGCTDPPYDKTQTSLCVCIYIYISILHPIQWHTCMFKSQYM